MDWGTLIAGVGGAAIGAGAALVGVYVGPQLQAKHELAQWRRDKLLQLCSDLLSAGTELAQIGLAHGADKNVPFPTAVENRMLYAYGGIRLLSPELATSADEFQQAATAVYYANDSALKPMNEASSEAFVRFLYEAHTVLFDKQPRYRSWSWPWKRVRYEPMEPDPATEAMQQPSDKTVTSSRPSRRTPRRR